MQSRGNNPENRGSVLLSLIAIANAFRCPTSTMCFLPLDTRANEAGVAGFAFIAVCEPWPESIVRSDEALVQSGEKTHLCNPHKAAHLCTELH
jgi:hypothetical protein